MDKFNPHSKNNQRRAKLMCNVFDFGASGNGTTDDTEAILHALKEGDGRLEFPHGNYLITKTIEIPLDKQGPAGISGSDGTARIIMAGPGPAFRFLGTHEGTGDPLSVKDSVRIKQRLPTVSNIEITGTHPEADGLEFIGTMQPVVDGVLIQRVRNGIRLHKRNRNVIISNSNIYFNTGIGIFLDAVNLHQINITGNHISYNRLGGIRIAGSEIRNLQITGNDIEYNNHRAFKVDPEPTAEIYIDTTGPGASVAEVAITSNTIQATESEGGANIHIIGDPLQKERPGLWTIAGNIIGSQEVNVILTGCHSMVISGNSIYSGVKRNLVAEKCTQIVMSGNDFRRHTETRGTGWKFTECENCVISGCSIKDDHPDGQPSGSLAEFSDCHQFTITGCQFLNGAPHGLDLNKCTEFTIGLCSIQDTREKTKAASPIRWRGESTHNQISNCRIGPGGKNALQIEAASNVKLVENMLISD